MFEQRLFEHRMSARRSLRQDGQVTALFAGVLALAAALIIGIALVSEAMVHRARARNAADAVALAVATDAVAATQITGWYQERGVVIEASGDQVVVNSGPSRAASSAQVIEGTVERSPALVAIVARVEQLAGTSFADVRWTRFSITLNVADAAVLLGFASDFQVCAQPVLDPTSSTRTFRLCSSGPS